MYLFLLFSSFLSIKINHKGRSYQFAFPSPAFVQVISNSSPSGQLFLAAFSACTFIDTFNWFISFLCRLRLAKFKLRAQQEEHSVSLLTFLHSFL